MAAVCSFPDIESAVMTTVQTLQLGIPMGKIEFLDDTAIKTSNSCSNLNYPLLPTLFMEFSGSPLSVEEQSVLVSRYQIVNYIDTIYFLPILRIQHFNDCISICVQNSQAVSRRPAPCSSTLHPRTRVKNDILPKYQYTQSS